MARWFPNPDILAPRRDRLRLGSLVLVLGVSALLVVVTEAAIAAFSATGLSGLLDRNPLAMLLDVGVVAAVATLLWGATNRLGVALTIISLGLLLAAAVHIRKLQLINRPLLPWDFLEWRQITSLAPTLFPGGKVAAILAGLLVLALIVAIVRAVSRGRPRHPLTASWRGGLALTALAFLGIVAFHAHITRIQVAFARFGVVHQVWNQKANFQTNGLPLMLLWNWEGLRYEPGGDYSATAVRSALGDAGTAPKAAAQPPVDVIVYMAESLWDPTKLGVRFNADPMPFLRGLASTSTSGQLVSPTFGGGTANAEFEVLTGLSMAFLPDGAFPYLHYVLRPVDSLPSLFREAGYRTVAIHPFHAWYWSRDVVYPLLGIDAFQSLTDFSSAKLEGPWVSDEALVDHIVDELSKDAQPRFVMAITMSTHGPYNQPLSGKEEVQVVSELSAANRHELTSYAHKVRQTDRALERLVQWLQSRQRPAVLVVFGDHLPMLGPDYSAYRETKFLAEPWTDAQRERMAEVPVVFWTNFPREREDLHLSMSLLAPRILEAAGMKPQGFFAFLSELSRQVPVVRSDLLRDATGKYLPADARNVESPEPGSWQDWLRRYRLLTYDRLVGSNFSAAPPPGHVAAGGP